MTALYVHDLVTDDYYDVVNKLRMDCPNLLELSISSDPLIQWHGGHLRGLDGLKTLQNLHLDLEFLLDPRDESQLLDIALILPPNLIGLKVFNAHLRDVDFLMTENMMVPHQYFPGGTQLRHISLYVGHSRPPSREPRASQWDRMALAIWKNLQAQGVDFQIYRHPRLELGEQGQQPMLVPVSNPAASSRG